MKILKCIDTGVRYLKLNKIYVCNSENNNKYNINYNGKYGSFFKWRFKDITREYKLKQLL